MATSVERRCSHAHCGCPAGAGGATYCSGYCASVDREETEANAEEGACACGHDACNESQRAGESRGDGDEVTTSIGRGPGARTS